MSTKRPGTTTTAVLYFLFYIFHLTQRGLFDNGDREKSDRLMRAIDAINAKVDTPVRWAIEGIYQPWQVKFKRRSKRYTTRWDEPPVVV